MKHDLYGPSNDQRGRIIGHCYRCGRDGVVAGDECVPALSEEQRKAFQDERREWLDRWAKHEAKPVVNFNVGAPVFDTGPSEQAGTVTITGIDPDAGVITFRAGSREGGE